MDSKELSKVASWSQLVTKIQDDKRNAVYSPEASSTQTKIAYQKVNKSKCSFDPIKVVYKDPILEKQYEREKEKKSTLFVEQVTQKKPYNPINHEGELTRFPIRKSTQPKSISRGYHLLSNVSEEEQKNISLTYNDVTNASVSILPLERHKKCSGRPTGRPFNILSNKYIVNDDIIRRGEEERAKERVKETFWDTHHIHVLRGEYYDVKKDKEVQEQTKCRTEAKSRQQLAKLPPSYLSSEGRNYNILSLQEHSGKSDLIEANSASLKRDNSMATIRLTRERYNNSVLHEREKDGDRETRRLNRSRLGREFEQKYESNFNFINHSTTNNVISAEEPKCSNFVPRLSLPITKS